VSCICTPPHPQVLSFAAENQLVVLADEVYQDNIWAEGKGAAQHAIRSITHFSPVPVPLSVSG